MKAKAAQVKSEGSVSGSITLKKVPQLEQPSIAAASSSPFGTFRKAVLSSSKTKGREPVMFAKITPT